MEGRWGGGHKVRIGVINCYCTLGAGRRDQRKGTLWRVMCGEIYFFFFFFFNPLASSSMPSVSQLTFETSPDLCEIYTFSFFFHMLFLMKHYEIL